MPFDLLKRKKDDPKEKLSATQRALTHPFIDKAINFISAGQTLPEAEQYQKEQIENIQNIPKAIKLVADTYASDFLKPQTSIEQWEEAQRAMSTPLETITRVPKAIQRAIPPMVSGQPQQILSEAIQGLIRPELTPPGFLGGEARKMFPAPSPESGLFTPANITSALLGTAGELGSFELGLGFTPGRIKSIAQKAKVKGAFRSGEELVDTVTKNIISKRDPSVLSKGKDITKTLNELRPKVRKAILGSEKPTEILTPEVGQALMKKQTPKKLASDWLKSVKKVLGEEVGAKEIIKPKDIAKALEEIPVLKNTQEAIAFGSKATPAMVEALKQAQTKQNAITDKLQAEGKPAIEEATKGQLLREAVESAEGKIKDITKAKPEEALIEEAKKFKTSDEFVKSKGKKVYHGSPKEFDKFSYEFLGEQGTSEGYGFYFTDKKEIAEGYKKDDKGKLFEVVLDIKKPLNFTEKKITKPQLKKFIKAVDPDGSGYLSNWGDVSFEGYEKILNEAIKNEFEGSNNDVDLIHGIINAEGRSPERIYPILKETLGYDGIIVDKPEWGGDQKVYLAFSPEQITETKQLTDIFNKAQQPPKQPPTKPPVAAGEPEEPKPSIIPKAKVKGIVREVTGLKDVSKEIKITEKQALKRELKEEAKAATLGLREGKKLGFEEGKLKVREVLQPKLAKEELKAEERFTELKRQKEIGLLKEDIRRRQELSKLEEQFKGKVERTKERKALSDEVKRLINNIKTKPTKDLPIEYKDAIEDIKNNIDFDKVRLSNILKREKASKLIDEDVREAARELSSINAEDMTLADLQEVEDLVSQIYHSGVHEQRFLSNEIKIKFDEAVIKASEQLKTKPGKTELPLEKILNEETFASRAKRVSKQYLYENRRPEAIFEELDNFKKGGAFTEVAWKPTIEGTYKYQTQLDGLIDSVRSITQQIKGKNVGKKSISIPGIKRKITVSDAMGVYAHSKNSANKAHLKAMGFDQNMIDSVIGQLDPSFKKVVDEVMVFLSEELFPKIDATNVKMKGTHLEKVEEYFPIINLLDVGSVESVKMDLKAREQFRRSGISKSFTKQREVSDKSNKAFKKLDFFSTLYQHLNNSSYYMNMSEPIRDASKFLFDPTVKAKIRDRYGDSLNRINRKWIDDITKNRLPMATNTFEAYADTIGKNAVMYFIGSSLSVAMKQPASFMQGAGMIGGANAFNGLFQVTTNPMAVLRFASNRSPLIRTRVKLFSQERDFQEIFGGKSAAGRFGAKDIDIAKGTKAVKQKVGETAMMPIQIMDMVTVLSIWKGAYDGEIAKNVSPDEARKTADRAIRRTQPMGGIINLPESFRGNVLMRQITRLKNQPSQNVNLMIDAMKKFARSDKEFKDVLHFGKDAFWWFLAPAVLWGMLSRKRVQRDREEVSKDLLNFGLGGLPIFGQLLSAFITPYYESDLLNSFLAKIKGTQGRGSEEKKLKSTIESAGIGLGVPGGASIARLFFGQDLQQKILGGESQATRLKYEYQSALQTTDKKERLEKIKEVNRKAKKKGLSVAKISKDAKSWTRNDLREKYKLQGNIDSIENLRKIRKMPKEDRSILIRTYSENTQESLRNKL